MTPLPASILVVDDEETIRTIIAEALTAHAHHVQVAATSDQALRACETTAFDLVLLDLKIPGAMDGLALLAAIRQRWQQTIVIMLTGYGTLDSAITALRAGAFDYLTKPVSVAHIVESVERGLDKQREETRRHQLIAHLEATLNALKDEEKTVPDPPQVAQRFAQTATLVIDRQKRLVVRGNEPIDLTATEFDLLDYLARAADRILTASELLKATQGSEVADVDARPMIRVHIQRLRQKLGDDPENPRYILNVRGKGYRFVG
ncbi:MAG: response regulator transcription factor [Chloroflexi bacterium]|nr:response regulator transcription factor [Chloroflexota bacterium]